jgi:hypothetical protein
LKKKIFPSSPLTFPLSTHTDAETDPLYDPLESDAPISYFLFHDWRKKHNELKKSRAAIEANPGGGGGGGGGTKTNGNGNKNETAAEEEDG